MFLGKYKEEIWILQKNSIQQFPTETNCIDNINL